MSRRLLVLLPYAALAAVLAVVGYWLMYTAYMVYDDEGYVLWSLRTYGSGAGLYEPVFSQYGPFFFLFYRTLHAILGFAFDNDTGRLITLGYWVAIALLSGWLTWRLARSHAAAAAAVALTFTGLVAMIREPIHPGGLIALLVAAGAVLTVEGILRDRPRLFAVAAGAVGGALALTKINLGAFFILAAASWMLLSVRSWRAAWLVALLALVIPRLLMASLWPAPWVTQFALIFACGALALIPALAKSVDIRPRPRSWVEFTLAGVLVAAATIGTVVAQGTSLAAIWRGVIVAPLSHPNVYSFPAAWLPGSATLAVFLLALALLVQLRPLPPGTRIVVAVLRLAAAAWFLLGALKAEDEGMIRFAFSYGPSLAWLMTLPLAADPSGPAARARLWLAWVFAWQMLHAYPVAGSQMAWGVFLWPALVAVGVAEACAVLPGGWTARRPSLQFWRLAGAALLLAAAGTATWRFGRLGELYYVNSLPLGLPGAKRLRPPPDTRSQLLVIQQNLQAHADVVFSLPGMFSLNIWSGRPTPTDANATHWFSLLTEAEQQAIVARLEASPRAALVTHRYLMDFLARDGFTARGPLADYLALNFERAFSAGYYEFSVHKGRTIAALSTATYHPASPAHVDLVLAPTDSQQIASIAVTPLDDSTKTLHSFQPTPASPWTLQPIHPDGTLDGPSTQPAVPFQITTLSRLTIPLSPEFDFATVLATRAINSPQAPTPGQFILRNPAGAEITAAYLLR